MPKPVVRHEVEQPLDQSIRLIALTQGQNAIVSAGDYQTLMEFNWFAHWHPNRLSYYAKRWSDDQFIGMHSFLVPCRDGFVPDHINGDTLDNRRDNLQELPHGLNLLKGRLKSTNTSGSSGISFDKSRGLYMVRVGSKHYGRHRLLSDAIAVRNETVAAMFAAGGFRLS